MGKNGLRAEIQLIFQWTDKRWVLEGPDRQISTQAEFWVDVFVVDVEDLFDKTLK